MDKTTKNGSFRMFQGLGQEPDNKMQLKHEKEKFMRTAIRTIILVAVIAIICCMAGCRSSDEDTTPSESTGNPTSSESFTTQSECSEEVSPEGSVSSSIDSEASVSNESLPNGEIPQPGGRSEIDAPGSNQAYEVEKITLSLDDAQEFVITDDTAKTTILGYMDSMKESPYNVENTPPVMGGAALLLQFTGIMGLSNISLLK